MAQGKTKTTADHKCEGTYRADRHGPKVPIVIYSHGPPPAPDDLDERGKRLWDQLVASTPAQLLCDQDWPSLHQLCRWFSIAEQLTLLVQEMPLELKILDAAAKASRVFQTHAAKWGLNPLDRAKVRTDNSVKRAANPLDQLKSATIQSKTG